METHAQTGDASAALSTFGDFLTTTTRPFDSGFGNPRFNSDQTTRFPRFPTAEGIPLNGLELRLPQDAEAA
jgi:hypothetical protein